MSNEIGTQIKEQLKSRIGGRKVELGWLLSQHLDRMSETLKDAVSGAGSKPTGSKALTYRLQIKHFETLLIADLLDPKYYAWLKKEYHEPSSNITMPGQTIKYFDAISEWMQMLVLYARSKKHITDKSRTYFKDDFGV